MDPRRLFDTNSLVQRAQGGDERALNLLYERYIHRAESWTRGRIPSSARSLHDTESVAHEVLVKSILKTTSEGHLIRSSFRSYVRGAVRNRLIDLGNGRQWSFEDLAEDLTADAPSELERVLEEEFEAHVRRRIGELPFESRQILHLRFERGLSFAEIADLLVLPSEDASRMRVNRVLGRLREELEEGL